MRSRLVLATNLRRERQSQGLSQEELAGLASLDRTYVSSIERCRYAVTLDVLDRLSEALAIPPSDLLRPQA